MPILNLGNNYEYTGNGIKSLKRNDGVEVTRFKVRKGQTIKIGLKLFSRPTQDASWSIYFENTEIASFAHLENSSSFDLNKVYEKTYTASTDGEIFIKLWGNANSDVFEFQLWAELDNLTEYEQHEGQSYIMPVQQEMLDGDKFLRQTEKWYEKHGWKKVIFNGKENFQLISNNRFQLNLINAQYPKCIEAYFATNAISNIANGVSLSSLGTITDNYRISANYDSVYFKINEISLEDFKAKLKKLYDAGIPVVAYYKLAEPQLLECTEEQNEILDELTNARTYKNVTNITTDSKAILSLDYAKDQETQNQKMQNEIDEIKQLLSTTQTSALLLDNMQTDIESEVK